MCGRWSFESLGFQSLGDYLVYYYACPARERLSTLGVECVLCCRMLLVSASPSGLTQLVDKHDAMLVQT